MKILQKKQQNLSENGVNQSVLIKNFRFNQFNSKNSNIMIKKKYHKIILMFGIVFLMEYTKWEEYSIRKSPQFLYSKFFDLIKKNISFKYYNMIFFSKKKLIKIITYTLAIWVQWFLFDVVVLNQARPNKISMQILEYNISVTCLNTTIK